MTDKQLLEELLRKYLYYKTFNFKSELSKARALNEYYVLKGQVLDRMKEVYNAPVA